MVCDNVMQHEMSEERFSTLLYREFYLADIMVNMGLSKGLMGKGLDSHDLQLPVLQGIEAVI